MTELEHIVLAIVGRDGPLSAYAIKKEFSGSLTPAWSVSTGTVYPCIRRLVALGLVEASEPEGGRSRRTLSITPSGRSEIVKWLAADTAPIAAATPDPIRTRCHFLSLMSPADRVAFLAAAALNTERALSSAEATLARRREAGGGRLEQLVGDGVLFQLRARREWLVQMGEAHLEERNAGDSAVE